MEIEFFSNVPCHMKTRVCLKYFVLDCLYKPCLASNEIQAPLKYIGLTIFVTTRSFGLETSVTVRPLAQL